MNFVNNAIAGTLESNDIRIMVMANENAGIEIELESVVEKQFGKQIRKVISETLEKIQIDNVKIIATDKGALDYTIKARVACAVYRACDIYEDFNWEVFS
ncbi:MAG: citrate lyase acyl carrier protein [Clostridium sp.]|uniref:citrate lyase acyl carrier protein n=1 Tax=Clostridium sp. TaxID=1506 RepID=UPI003D6D8873